MAIRRPLILDNTDMKEMTDVQIEQIVDRIIYLYSQNPSVILTVSNTGGTLGTITDTRRIAGAASTSVSSFPTEAVTAEPGTVSVGYNRIIETVQNTSATADTNNLAFPVYSSSGNIRSMSLTDLRDTFILPAINRLSIANNFRIDNGGTYRIHTSTSLKNHTLVSNIPVFSNTQANTLAYVAAEIPEAVDQPTITQNYYLLRVDSYPFTTWNNLPIFVRSSDFNVQEYTENSIDSILENEIRHMAAAEVGSRIRYGYSTGNIKGSGMVDSRLDGAGNYQTHFVNADDYRAQEFPNGVASTISTSYLRIRKE